MSNNVTLQINASPGDINYAALTIPAIVKQHSDIPNRLLVVDCCRPQSTKLIDADKKFPKNVFAEKVVMIKAIAKNLLDQKVVTEVCFLEEESDLFEELSKKYLNKVYKTTHGAGGTANMSYWAGIDIPKSKYVLHYDCDIIIYQSNGYKWVDEALQYFNNDKNIVMAVPRLCPPLKNRNLPSAREGRPFFTEKNYWVNDWFSTRHFLLDKDRLEKYLPLVRGKVLIELLLRKYGRRAFPIDPEILLFKSIGSRGGKRMILKNEKCWITHPLNKPPQYLSILNELISSVSNGSYPIEQEGEENINMEAWVEFLENKKNQTKQTEYEF